MDEAIIGLNLCPFAREARDRGALQIEVSGARDPMDAIRDALDSAMTLLEATERGERSRTTLIVYPGGLEQFGVYLDVVETLRHLLSEAGADGVLQVATFHPRYQFEGVEADDMSHFTNRSPYPIIHLLLEEDVSRALIGYPDPEKIPSANIERLHSMGTSRIIQLWSRWTPVESLASGPSDELG